MGHRTTDRRPRDHKTRSRILGVGFFMGIAAVAVVSTFALLRVNERKQRTRKIAAAKEEKAAREQEAQANDPGYRGDDEREDHEAEETRAEEVRRE